MTEQFDTDLGHCRGDLAAARAGLLAAVRSLSDADLDRGRRGGWQVRRVLEHVIHSEWLYARVVTHLRGHSVEGDLPDSVPATAADALAKLDAARAALLGALEGVDEQSFYNLQQVGPEEYSVFTVLENAANHDREHAAQIRDTVAGQ